MRSRTYPTTRRDIHMSDSFAIALVNAVVTAKLLVTPSIIT